jgi:hypothetical protein
MSNETKAGMKLWFACVEEGCRYRRNRVYQNPEHRCHRDGHRILPLLDGPALVGWLRLEASGYRARAKEATRMEISYQREYAAEALEARADEIDRKMKEETP